MKREESSAMVPLFLGLTLANFIVLCGTLVLGYITGSNRAMASWHMLAGVLAAIVCIGVHCIVFTYFIATAKWVQHAIFVKSLDPALAAPTRSFKAQAFPAALVAMASVFVVACAGALVDAYAIPREVHHMLALAMLLTNAAAAVVELGAIRRNGKLIDRVLEAAGPEEAGAPVA